MLLVRTKLSGATGEIVQETPMEFLIFSYYFL